MKAKRTFNRNALGTLIVSIAAVCFGIGSAFGDDYEEQGGIGWYYSVTNGEATITGKSGSLSGDILFPETLGGYPVVALKANAIYDAGNAKSITFPDCFRTLERGNFRYTQSLTNMTFGTGLQEFHPFDNHDVFQSFTVPDGNPYFAAEGPVLYNKDKTTLIMCGANVTSFDVPSHVKVIGPGAFSEMDSLTSVTFPSGLTEIGNSAFYWCRNLESVSLPANLQFLGDSAFSTCGKIESVSVPATVAKIGDSAFSNCDALEALTIAEGVRDIGNSAFNSCQELTKVVVPNSVTNIGGWAFEYCTKLSDVTIGSGVVKIGDPQEWYIDEWDGEEYLSDPSPAFGDCDSLLNFKLASGNKVYEEIGGCLFLRATPKTSKTLAVYPSGRTDFYFTGDVNVTTIAPAACAYCGKLEDIVITNSIREIGVEGFAECQSLRRVVIPNGPTNISYGAFQMNMQLEYVEVAGTVKTIGDYAFMHGYMPEEYVNGQLILHEGIEEIGSGVIERTRDLRELVVPDSVTKIGEGAFEDSMGLRRLTLGSGVTEIPSSLCSYDQALRSVTIRGKVTSIGDWAFGYCDKLENINLPDSLETIGYRAFWTCRRLSYVSIPAATIGNEAFMDCESLARVDFSDSLRTIETNAFGNCYALRAVVIPEGIETIAPRAFWSAGIEKAYLPKKLDGAVETDASVYESIFYRCPLAAEDVIFYGNEGPAQVTVTFMSQGKVVETCKYLANMLDYLPGATADGLAFAGWYTAEEGGHLLADEDLTGNITAYARWIESPFIDTGAQEWNPAEDEAFPGEVVWSTGDLPASGEASASIAVVGPASVSFFWRVEGEIDVGGEDLYGVFVDGELVASAQSEDWQSAFVDVAASGKHIVTWTLSRGPWSYGSGSALLADIRVVHGTAKAITFDPNGGTLEEGAVATRGVVTALGDLPFADKDGFAFAGWWTALEGGERVTAATKPASDATYYAHWVELPFTVSGGKFYVAEDGSWATIRSEDSSSVTASVTLRGPCMVSFEWRHVADRWSTSLFRVDGDTETWLDTDKGWEPYTWTTDDTEEHVIEWEFSGGWSSGPGQMRLRNIGMGTPYDITFDPNDGYSPTVEKRAGKLGTLPVPYRFDYVTFDGWYTAAEGGEKVTSETPVTGPATYYGRWVESPVVTYWGNLWLFESDGSLVSDNNCNEYNSSVAEKELRGAPGTLTFRWRMQSDSGNGTFEFLVADPDDDDPDFVVTNSLAKSSDGWVTERYVFTKDLSVRWSYSVGANRGGIERGWLKDIKWKPGVVNPVEWTVTFNANGGELEGESEKTVMDEFPIGRMPVTTRADYGFAGWFTAANGGEEVTEGTPVTGNMTVYAHWVRIESPATVWTVTFNANGGIAPETVRAVTNDCAVGALPTAARNGYVFLGWFTAVDGGAAVTAATVVTGNTTFYAHWRVVAGQYKIRFIRNDGAGTMETREFDHGVSTPLPTVVSLGFARRGMVFKGWATSVANASAGKIWKTDGAIVATPTAVGTTMDAIAVWELADGYYGIKFNKNDGTGKWRGVACKYGEATALPSCGVGLGWTREGYTFKGWATSAANASAGKVWKGDRGTVQTGVPAGTTLNVYAIWEKIPMYTIKYGKYDGTGETFSSNYVWGVESHVPTATKGPLFWQRAGFDWLGWSTSPANADAGKVWKAGWGSISKPVDAGGTLSVYSCWRLQSGYYAIKFFRNDGTAAWRSKAFQHGVATRLPSMANGLRWLRAGYAFAGWATSAAKAAAGTVYRADWGIVTSPVAEGQTLTLYAIWRPIASANQVQAARSASAGVSHAATGAAPADGAVRAATIAVPQTAAAPGYYVGRLADDTGAYELIVGDDQEAGIVRIDFDSGESFFAEVEVVMFTDAAIVVATEDGDIYWLLP